MRQSRKLDHLRYAYKLPDGPAATGFADIHLIHNCLPEMSWQELDIQTSVAGISLQHPLLINAITGGAPEVTKVNRALAQLAATTGTAMAVGSQYSAFEYPEVKESYKVVRKVNPNGVIVANLGAHATLEQARAAIEMIEANALQIHLNAAQEIIMAEGERSFKGYLDNIATIASKVNVPVIAKEVGCGVGKEQAVQLAASGIRAIDIGGAGGTNFIAIEAARREIAMDDDFLAWGIPTALSAIEVASVLPETVDLVVSGGIRSPGDAMKSLLVGGRAVGIAAPFTKILTKEGPDQAREWVETFLLSLKRLMLLTGARTIKDCTNVPFVVTGFSQQWLTSRGIDTQHYGTRKKHG